MQVGYYYHYPVPFTAAFAAICGCILVFLTYNVIKLRKKYKQPYGEIKKDEFYRKNGALMNFASNTPMVLILFCLAELGRTNCGLLFFIAGLYIIARISHIHSLYHFEKKQNSFRIRIFAMMTTFSVIIVLSAINLYIAQEHMF